MLLGEVIDMLLTIPLMLLGEVIDMLLLLLRARSTGHFRFRPLRGIIANIQGSFWQFKE